MSTKEIAIRAAKTFIQAFFGVLIPEVAAVLNGGFTDVSTFIKTLAPFVAAAFASGISATWNLIESKISLTE